MLIARRFLPSISSLVALEAVDRLGSASAAAEELALTQSAVSRQLQVLEQQMQVQLLIREKKRLILTDAAKDYVQQVRAALEKLAQASLKLKANPLGGSLDLAILPAFGMHWLAPRLSQFARLHPEVTVNLSTRLAPFDFSVERFDAAIHFGRQDWQGVDYLPLMEEHVLPVCTPSLLKAKPDQAQDLLAFPLLHLQTRVMAWQRWLEAQGIQMAMPRGMMFDHFSTMAQAAIHGLGIALLPDFLVARDIAEGRLVVAFGGAMQSVGSYYLVWPRERSSLQPLQSFRSWLQSEAQDWRQSRQGRSASLVGEA